MPFLATQSGGKLELNLYVCVRTTAQHPYNCQFLQNVQLLVVHFAVQDRSKGSKPLENCHLKWLKHRGAISGLDWDVNKTLFFMIILSERLASILIPLDQTDWAVMSEEEEDDEGVQEGREEGGRAGGKVGLVF